MSGILGLLAIVTLLFLLGAGVNVVLDGLINARRS